MVLEPFPFFEGAFGNGRTILGEKTGGVAEDDAVDSTLLWFWIAGSPYKETKRGGILSLAAELFSTMLGFGLSLTKDGAKSIPWNRSRLYG